MKLEEIFNYLKYSELANINLGGEKGVAILEENYAALVPQIQLGMTELAKRFDLHNREIIVELHDGINLYTIHKDYATNSTSTQPTKYIVDTVVNPFIDTVLRLDEFYDEEGNKLSVNNIRDEKSVYLPSPTVIQVPWAEDDAILYVSYLAAPIKIELVGLNPATYEIDLPEILLEPLMFYVGSRLYSNYIDGEVGEGRSYFMKYEDSCNKISQYGLIASNETVREVFADDGKGWV